MWYLKMTVAQNIGFKISPSSMKLLSKIAMLLIIFLANVIKVVKCNKTAVSVSVKTMVFQRNCFVLLLGAMNWLK